LSILIDKLVQHYTKELPFVCYRKPRSKLVEGYFCTSDQLHASESFTEKGFVFAPFDDREKALVFLAEECEFLQEEIQPEFSESTANLQVIPSNASEHIDLVRKGVEAIGQGAFQKVVLSRKERVQLNDFEIEKVFQRMLNHYPNAFVYVWFHPKVGLWLGATPERLVSLESNQFVTMALAGTQVFQGNEQPDWGEKERQEHQFVVDYIVSQIQDPTNGIILDEFKVSETYTAKAGSLLHLKADIQGTIGDFNLKELLKTLHPTPAVCGLPKEEAKEFILQNENYQRSFYTGFLGEMNVNEKTELFVNLRCAEIQNDEVVVYVGGGVTADSDPQKEWEETFAKTQTIKKVL
jgi:isochorismate synthase